MNKAIAVIGTVLMLIPSSCYASSIDKDKGEHFAAGMAIDMVESGVFPHWTPFERVLGVAVVAGCKEWYDSNHDGHSAEWGDFAATCIGGLTGEGTVWLVHKTW